jgi:hypothetical protein
MLLLLLTIRNFSFAQDSSKAGQIISFPRKCFSSLDKKTSSISDKLDKKSLKYLSSFQKQENKLRRKLWKKDSALAKQLFEGTGQKYSDLKKQLNSSTPQLLNKYQSVYSGHLDSLSTALNFLKNNNPTDNPALQKSLEQYKALQGKLNSADQIKKYLIERRQLLKQQFEKLGMVKELKKFRKDVYYYQQQFKEYKELFENPSKMEAKLMEVVLKLPQFKDFFAKNSLMGSMFALPGSSNSSTASVRGLQTRAMVNQSLMDRFGSSSVVTQQLQQNVQSAQGQLSQLKSKLGSFTSGSYGNINDEDIPGFKPNNQKTKSFLQRLEYGTNVQSQKARYFFPVTSDIGLSLGYKLNDKSSLGIGASYKLGWGNNWNSIRLSHQGVGLRSYIEWQIPSPVGGRRKGAGSFYFSGGYEQNYRSLISSIDQLRQYSSWQSSGLVGVSKKYSISKKMKGEMKLLWDFMSYQQAPKAQPILFRIGYSLK